MFNSEKTLQKIRFDGLPEEFPYSDAGCEASRYCLSCPLPMCKYDDPVWYQQYRRLGRDAEVLTVYRQEGLYAAALAGRFGVARAQSIGLLGELKNWLRDQSIHHGG